MSSSGRETAEPALAERWPIALSLEEAARLIGHYRWIETRIFEVMGGWLRTVSQPDVKLLLSDDSDHHAWHAELWWDRLPERCELEPDRLTVAANGRVEAFMEALADPADTLERLVGIYRVLLPHKVTTYAEHLEHASRIADGPTVRALGLVLADESADWQRGEKMIQQMLGTRADVQRAADHQGQLEALLLEAGGLAGSRRATPHLG